MTEREAEQEVERRHGRRLHIEPISSAFVWGFGAFGVLYFLDMTGMAQIGPWVQLAVGAAVGAGFYVHNDRKNREMRADVNRLIGR